MSELSENNPAQEVQVVQGDDNNDGANPIEDEDNSISASRDIDNNTNKGALSPGGISTNETNDELLDLTDNMSDINCTKDE